MSWVEGRGSWVWVNVVGKKKSPPRQKKKKKLKIKVAKSFKIHETKVSAFVPEVLFPFLEVSKANKRIL